MILSRNLSLESDGCRETVSLSTLQAQDISPHVYFTSIGVVYFIYCMSI